MNRYQLREEVRFILRDDSFPQLDINSALNRVIGDINNAGRFRFHQNSVTITPVAGTYSYAVPSTVLAEYSVVWAFAVVNKQALINKGSELIDPLRSGKFTEAGDLPTDYWRWGDNFLFDPIPNAVTAAYNFTVHCFKDVTELDGDLDTPGIPARYHRNVLAYGAASQISPAAMVKLPSGTISVASAFERAMTNMIRQELWEPYKVERFVPDSRWIRIHQVGNIGHL